MELASDHWNWREHSKAVKVVEDFQEDFLRVNEAKKSLFTSFGSAGVLEA
jgi:hypothetical protein